jgi:hypothetical protein
MLAWGEALAIDIDGTAVAPLAVLEVGHLNGDLLLRRRRRGPDRGSRCMDQDDGEQVWA